MAIEILNIDIEKQTHKILNDGSINIFLAGDFDADGKTIPQLKTEITEKLKEDIIEPEVSITLIKPRPVSVYVLGEVNNPGLYTLPYDLRGKDMVGNPLLLQQ